MLKVRHVVFIEQEPKSRRVQLLMQPSLHEAIKKKAEERGFSFNDYVHRILDDHAWKEG